jgi:hypothetical protein
MNAAIQLLLPILTSFAQAEIDSLAALPTQAAKRKRLLEWLNSSFVSGSPGGYVAAALVGRSPRAQDALIKALVGVRLNPSTTVQSLVFDRSSFGVEHAKAWAKAHDFRYGDVDVQPTTIRLRQKDPSRFRTFRTKGLTQGVQAVIARNPARRRRNPPVTNPLLAQMLALRTAYQYAHWNAKNYADHLLFEKLYTSLDGGIDILAEISQQHVEPVATPQVTARSLMAAENRIIKAAERAIEQDRPESGLENFLLGLIEHRERAKYLLNQRSDREANTDDEREQREAALEGGVYKNPTRYDVAIAPLGRSTKGQGPDPFIIDPETGRRRKMTVAELRRYARTMRSMAEDAPAYSRATYEASAEWHEDAADRLERRSARQKARKASIEGGVYKNPARRRRNSHAKRRKNAGLWDDAKVISAYTREQAIRDGALVDVSASASEAGIRFPTAMTRAAWETTVRWTRGSGIQDESGRLWDVVWMLKNAIQRSSGGALVRFTVYVVPNTGRGRSPRPVNLKAVVGPGDHAEPVITIMLPDED